MGGNEGYVPVTCIPNCIVMGLVLITEVNQLNRLDAKF